MVVDETSKEYTPAELELLEAVSGLLEHPKFRLLANAVIAEREKYRRNLATGIGMTGGAQVPVVDQRELDYKRGFWNGAIWALVQFPKKHAKDWEKFVAEQTKESDSA